MIHRRRQHPVERAKTFVNKPPPELEIRMELGLKGNAPPRIGHSSSELITGCDAWHPNRSQQMMHEERPDEQKPVSCDTFFAEV